MPHSPAGFKREFQERTEDKRQRIGASRTTKSFVFCPKTSVFCPLSFVLFKLAARRAALPPLPLAHEGDVVRDKGVRGGGTVQCGFIGVLDEPERNPQAFAA